MARAFVERLVVALPTICLYAFFFSLIRRPPRSTLFPYTTLSDLAREFGINLCRCLPWLLGRRVVKATMPARSEEHTSELQSLTNLVCRLLLEKKKKIKTNTLAP